MVRKSFFGNMISGLQVSIYTIKNKNGMTVKLLDFGASVYSVFVPDKNGTQIDVALGYEKARDYTGVYFGASIGRVTNRTEEARLTIEGTEYHLEQNNFEDNLHSGSRGTAKRMWEVKEHTDEKIVFIIEDDGLQGYPGRAVMEAEYEVTEDNTLCITYRGSCDRTTPFNMTNHTFFNLDGEGYILDHYLQINAESFTPVKGGRRLIPTGELRPVYRTPLDFRSGRRIGDDIESRDPQMQYAFGYDHNFVLNKEEESGLEWAATAWSEVSGIEMKVYTDRPCLQFYTGNFLLNVDGKYGEVYQRRKGLVLETQDFPNAVNNSYFPDILYKPGEAYTSRTEFRFGIRI